MMRAKIKVFDGSNKPYRVYFPKLGLRLYPKGLKAKRFRTCKGAREYIQKIIKSNLMKYGVDLKARRFRTLKEAMEYIKEAREYIKICNDALVIDALGGLESLRAVVDAGDLTDDQYEKLYDIYEQEMPYGTMKARTGDPYEFILGKLEDIVNRLISKEER